MKQTMKKNNDAVTTMNLATRKPPVKMARVGRKGTKTPLNRNRVYHITVDLTLTYSGFDIGNLRQSEDVGLTDHQVMVRLLARYLIDHADDELDGGSVTVVES